MNVNMKLKEWLILILPLLAVGLLLVAFGADEEEGGGGLGETPIVTGEPTIMATDVMTEETPMVETPAITTTASATSTAVVTIEATDEITGEATVETPTTVVSPTTEVSVETTPVITAEATAEVEQPHIVMRASDFIGMDIQDQMEINVGYVVEALADEAGTIQYVIVDLSVIPDLEESGTPTETVTGTTGLVPTANVVALTWDDFAVQLDDETEEDPDDVVIIYTGETEASTITPLNLDFLAEEGYVLEDDDNGEFDVPAEFDGLLQVGDYNDYDLQDTAENEVANIEDLLIDMSTGEILYAVADVGGFLGIGANTIAIPWEVLDLEVVSGDDDVTETEKFTLDVTEEFLTEAPTIDLDDTVPLVEEEWDTEIQSYWESMMP